MARLILTTGAWFVCGDERCRGRFLRLRESGLEVRSELPCSFKRRRVKDFFRRTFLPEPGRGLTGTASDKPRGRLKREGIQRPVSNPFEENGVLVNGLEGLFLAALES